MAEVGPDPSFGAVMRSTPPAGRRAGVQQEGVFADSPRWTPQAVLMKKSDYCSWPPPDTAISPLSVSPRHCGL